MCGICGIIDYRQVINLTRSLKLLNEAAAHRGPDDEGLVFFSPDGYLEIKNEKFAVPSGAAFTAGLGHKRLSILDLSAAGHQPMCDPSRRFWVVFNGEIYNYLELRQELAAKGWKFTTQTDTEVVLTAYLAWGRAGLERFNGMWALAIYDRETEKLFCARDRFGVKPFYYRWEKGVFAFASEIKQLLQLPFSAPEINLPTIADFFLWNYQSHTQATFINGIWTLPPSGYLELTRSDIETGKIVLQTYWKPEPTPSLDENQAITTFRELLVDAVKLRLRSDVPVGITLSGGLDSSSITCLAAQIQGEKSLKTFTAVYDDQGYSEVEYARQVTALTGAIPIYIKPNSNSFLNDWKHFIYCMEEPFSNLTYYSNWKVYEKISEHQVPVILNGQGADELLLGYNRYRVYNLSFLLQNKQYHQLFKEMQATTQCANLSYIQQLHLLFYFIFPTIRSSWRRRSVAPYLNQDFFQNFKSQTRHVWHQSSNRNRLQLQRKEFFNYQLQHLLRHEDRVSMHFAIEARVPFLDYRLFNFIQGQSDALLIHQGWTKYILRAAMEGILPESVRKRRDKMSFSTPTRRLLVENAAAFRELLNRHQHDEILNISQILTDFDKKKIKENLLISMCSYLAWRETFLDG